MIVHGNMTRRGFCLASASAFTGALIAKDVSAQVAENIHFNVAEYEKARILAAAKDAVREEPRTVTAIPPPVKGLSPNAYYSEDVEWWPKDDNPKAFEHRQGYTNPKAFTAHRDALVKANAVIGSCVAAWRLTQESGYAQHAMKHLRAWMLEPATRMEPALDHAASVPPASDGSPTGVEETVMLAEVVRAASFLCAYNGVATEEEAAGLRKWCSDFAAWLNESKPGFLAREDKNRTAICWTLQAAECARFARMGALSLECSHRFKDKLLREMNFDGEFLTELHRPDAYASSLFTLECLSLVCEVLSSPMERLWDYNLQDGRGMRSAVSFLYPFMESRSKWKYPADAEHFSDLPWRLSSLLFAGRAYSRPEYVELWKRLPAEPSRPEILRLMPVRMPALWTVRAPA